VPRAALRALSAFRFPLSGGGLLVTVEAGWSLVAFTSFRLPLSAQVGSTPKLRFGVEASTRLRDFAFRRLSARGFKRGTFRWRLRNGGFDGGSGKS
jgi:hypothetical protein